MIMRSGPSDWIGLFVSVASTSSVYSDFTNKKKILKKISEWSGFRSEQRRSMRCMLDFFQTGVCGVRTEKFM